MTKILPTELWFRITDFIPDDIIFKLAPINDLFYDVALDRRHRALTLDSPYPYELNHRISCIVDDPPTAARVRSLQINPMAIYAACCHGSLRSAKLRLIKNPHWPETFRKQAESNMMIENLSIAENLLDGFARLTNLNSYTIAWSHAAVPLPTFATSFLSAVWSVLSTTTALRSLTLDMPFHDVGRVFSVTPFKSSTYLTTLSLKLGHTILVKPEHSLTDLASFLNVLSPCLRSLSLHIIGHFDLSIFFATLKHFSLLKDLSLLLPCDPRHLSDAEGLTAFLNAHKTQLTSLVFSPHLCCGPRGTKIPKSTQQESSTWESTAFSVLSFPALQSLDLRLNPFGTRDEYVLNTPPKFTAAVARERLPGRKTFKGEDIDKDPVPLTLSILGRLILLDDVKMLLGPFSLPKEKSEEGPQHGIASIRVPESLILETHILSPNLLNLLWSTLPQLKSLNLTYTWIGELGCDNEQNFVKNLRKRTYPDWHLRDFTLISTTHEDARRRCERAIRKAVPSLQ